VCVCQINFESDLIFIHKLSNKIIIYINIHSNEFELNYDENVISTDKNFN
jgi:hypothetical protein